MPPKRPVFHREIGRSLKERRDGRGWSLNLAASMAARRGLRLSVQTLRMLEEGLIKNPDASDLKAIAGLYELAYADLVARFVKASYQLEIESDGRGSLVLPTQDEPAKFTAVPVLEDPIAAGDPLEISDARVDGHFAFETRWLDRQAIRRPLCVVVGSRERSMLGTIDPGELVLLDCAEDRRLSLKTDKIYAVNVDGGGTLKRVIVIDRGVLLVSDNLDKDKYPTRPVELEEGQSILDVVKGEVMWKGQRV